MLAINIGAIFLLIVTLFDIRTAWIKQRVMYRRRVAYSRQKQPVRFWIGFISSVCLALACVGWLLLSLVKWLVHL
jgi:hypothetical protein